MDYFLGVDIGSTKTHTLIANSHFEVVGFGVSGAGNPNSDGYDGMSRTVQNGLDVALANAGISINKITGAGFGVSGYDWESQEPMMRQTLRQLGLTCPFRFVNDSIPPILAGSIDSWGVSLIAGTGCNCWGWDKTRQHIGRVTGFGFQLGEHAGASELVWEAMKLVAYEWTKRGKPTAMSQAFIAHAGVTDLTALLKAYTDDYRVVDANAAPLIFEVAHQGDEVAQQLIRWAGVELGEMAIAVIRQLHFQTMAFDVVLSGSLFKGGRLLIEPMWQTVTQFAPQARMVHLSAPPVFGSVLLGMEQVGVRANAGNRRTMLDTLTRFYNHNE
jgi:N-acetylglucosamine kinase-like BadF-type ATPase